MEKREIVEKIKKLQEVYGKCSDINGFLADYLDCLEHNTRGYELSPYFINFRSMYKSDRETYSDSVILKNKNNDSMIMGFCPGFTDNRFYISYIYHDCEGKVFCRTTENNEFFMEQTAVHYDSSNIDVLRSIKNTKYSSDGLISGQGYKENSRTNGKTAYLCKIFGNDMIISDYTKGTHLYTGEVVDLFKNGEYSIDNMKNNSHNNLEWNGKKVYEAYVDLEQIDQLARTLGYTNLPSNESISPITY